MGASTLYKKIVANPLDLELVQSMHRHYILGCLVLLGLTGAHGANTTIGKL